MMSATAPNGMTFIAQAMLSRAEPPRAAAGHPPPAGTTRSGCMRDALTRGGMTARELAAVAGLTRPDLVSALLKHDLADGRIVRRGNVYELNTTWADDDKAQVQAAIRLLRRRGFTVRKDRAQ
jgi:hypothetical protein